MATDVTLPALGESVTEGTVTRWLKQVGDTVEVDEALLEVSTDKVDTEVPSPVAGVVEEILVPEDETVEVGAVLVRIGDGSGASAPAADDAPAASEEAAPEEAAPEQAAEPEAAADAPAEEAPAEADDAADEGGDSTDITLPALGESVTEGTVTRWLKQVGDTVEVDEALLEVSTDKVDTEVPSPVAGTIQEILVKEDETVEVGAVLARVGSGSAPKQAPAKESTEELKAEDVADAPAEEAGEKPAGSSTANAEPAEESAAAEPAAPAGESAAAEPAAAEPAAKAAPAAPASSGPKPPSAPKPPAAPAAPAASAESAQPASKTDPRYVTPIVRKLAESAGVDLTKVTGTGVGGRIRKEDVLAAAEAQRAQAPAAAGAAAPATAPTAPTPFEVSELRGTTQKMSRLRKVISQRAVESMTQTAQLTTIVEVDVTRIANLRQSKKGEFLEKTGSKLSFLPFFTLAAVEALQSHPIINSTVQGDEIVYPAHENISMAVDTERGLLTPVIKNAEGMSIADIAGSIDELATKARDNKLMPDDLAGGTFTVTNTGSRGALFDTPVVFLPQEAILGTGVVAKRPAVVKTADGEEVVAIRSMVYLALSYDHRIIDGADAARFLSQMKARLEEGAFEGNLGI